MFHSARIKLTIWYMLITLFVSALFSLALYEGVNSELNRIEQREQLRAELQERLNLPISTRSLNPEMIEESRTRLRLTLLSVNAIILFIAGLAGYVLAGRTLKPIEDMVEEQNRFIADASHELRTPLTAMRTSSEVALRDKKMTMSDARKLLSENLDEVKELQYLSNNLLNLAQMEQNGMSHMERVNILEILKSAQTKVEKLAEIKKIKIEIKGESKDVLGDRDRLIELFIVFLDNAIKYSNEHTKIDMSIKQDKKYVAIQIHDSGKGIQKKDIPFIFDRFYRADSARSREDTGGYGLGLSIAKKIIDLHSGEIYVKSEIKKGTTFTVKIPAA